MSHLGRKRKRILKRLGHKSKNIAKSLGSKGPKILMDAGGALQAGGKIGEILAGAIALTGNEEIALPLLAASEGAIYGGKALSGAGKAGKKANDGDYIGAAQTIQKTAVDASSDRKKHNKKFG
jgi:hypothetical protein